MRYFHLKKIRKSLCALRPPFFGRSFFYSLKFNYFRSVMQQDHLVKRSRSRIFARPRPVRRLGPLPRPRPLF